jgi:hypothetical protein
MIPHVGQAGHPGGEQAAGDGRGRQPDQHLAPVEAVGQPAHRQLRQRAAGDEGGEEQRDLRGLEAHPGAVERPDHAERRARERGHQHAGHRQR